MEKWCIKPENKKQAFIVGKWFDENNGGGNKKFYQKECSLVYHVYGMGKGNVWFTNKIGRELTFQEFENEILKKNVEPIYEIY